MRTSTIAATPRLFLRTPELPIRQRDRGVADAGLRELAIGSHAGLHRRRWLGRLRRALAEDLLVLHFQPIIRLAGGRVSHYEALVRLADEPGGRVLAPGSFLPAAERYGLIRWIDRVVLEKAIATLAAAADGTGESCAADPAAALTLAVNLSAVSVTDPSMASHIERLLARAAVDPPRLVIELTETASICDMPLASAFCTRMRALGCAIALDDFGSGFGSLHYLKHLPFDYLKIDGEFIRGLAESPNDQLVVRALVGIARGMGARTIAEFVQDARTLALLARLGVDFAQGFACGRPAPALAYGLARRQPYPPRHS